MKTVRSRGELDLGGIKLPCFVLNDGSRVLTGSEMLRALGFNPGKTGGSLERSIPYKTFKSAYYDKANRILSMVKSGKNNFKTGIGGFADNAIGYDATLLIDIADLYIEAYNEGILDESKFAHAKAAEVLIRSVAKVGIIALIDEATGYQYDREKDELQKILKAYIAEELLPWQKRFPDIYYKELFRLNGWDFTVNGIKKRPLIIGKWTNTLIYEQLPKGVLDELKKKTPKSITGNKTARYHQSLTLDVGEPNLNAQISQTITLFQLSDNMAHMWHQFSKLRLRQQGQLEIPFKFDDKGHTIEDDDR